MQGERYNETNLSLIELFIRYFMYCTKKDTFSIHGNLFE